MIMAKPLWTWLREKRTGVPRALPYSKKLRASRTQRLGLVRGSGASEVVASGRRTAAVFTPRDSAQAPRKEGQGAREKRGIGESWIGVGSEGKAGHRSETNDP